MTYPEFLALYKERHLQMLNAYIQILKDNFHNGGEYVCELFKNHDGEISYKENVLISQLMNENGLDHTVKIIQGFDAIPIESELFKSAFSIILENKGHYSKTTEALFLELSYLCP